MLYLDSITKDYKMKGGEVKALKGITLCFRKSEFVSVLGPSGCGKTTLLNILGGLDKYTSGDLVIDGKSTKNFNDHDWDVYRNHRIGFVFQSYNLIPQENILENVELALTISGIKKEERERRAKEALDKVGLKGLYKKKPNQLSGGQCQRVAIARALVNEPEILLADEPTGALDSETSVQIMDLIKEISKDRLVIMVTHNPELADKYSTRIVRLLDGNLVDDTNPYTLEEERAERSFKEVDSVESTKTSNKNTLVKGLKVEKKQSAKKEKAKMSWFTAFSLSMKNLLSKAKRTAMIMIASSIGIIGVSLVLSVSGGVTGYIDSMQDEMLSGNPVTVKTSGYDLSALMDSTSNSSKKDIVQEAAKDGYINVNFMIESLIDSADQMGSAMIQNDITEDYLNFIKEMPSEYVQDISYDYGINVANNIYTDDNLEGQPDGAVYSLSAITNYATAILSKTDYSSYSSIISSMSSTFCQSLENEEYVLSQYDIVEGKVAKEENEIMIVLSSDEKITDFTLTLLGYYSQEQFMNLIYKFTENDKYDDQLYQQSKEIALTKLIGKKFTYYPNDTIFTENTGNPINPYSYSYQPDSRFTDGLELKVVGVLKPKEGRQYSSLSSGFYYTTKFTDRFLENNYDSSISKYCRAYVSSTGGDGIISGKTGDTKIGIYYDFKFSYEGTEDTYTAYVGESSSMSALLGMMGMGGSSASYATLTPAALGGNNLPTGISFYPQSFEKKYLVTDYLDKWNSENTLTVGNKTITKDDRNQIKYSDNLQIVIDMINTVIDIVTIALICFTALSLVVSTVMIGIITYVSVIERIKEIGTIRALGGRKKDVSHLFYAETFILGLSSGVFGIVITYIIQTILNVAIHANFAMITQIASLSIISALVIVLISILLTTIAGLLPAKSAANKDPVIALRSE